MDLAQRLEAVEKRLRYLEDQEKIRECLHTYGFNADLGRSEKWADGWTPDGVYDLEDQKWRGRDDLLDLIGAPMNNHKQIENRSQHAMLNLFIRIEGDTAWAEGYSATIVRKTPEKIELWTCAYNHFEFVRSGERWLLKYRTRRNIGGDEWGGKAIRKYLDDDGSHTSAT